MIIFRIVVWIAHTDVSTTTHLFLHHTSRRSGEKVNLFRMKWKCRLQWFRKKKKTDTSLLKKKKIKNWAQISEHCIVLICQLHSDTKEHVSITQVIVKSTTLESHYAGKNCYELIQVTSIKTLSKIVFVDDKENQIEQLKNNKFKKR